MRFVRFLAPLAVLLSLLVPVRQALADYPYTSYLNGWNGSNFVTNLPNDGTIGPIGLIWDSQDRFWVNDKFNDCIYRFSATGGDAGPNVVNCGLAVPHGLTFSRAGRLYAILNGNGSLVELNTNTGGVVGTVLPAGSFSWALGLATDPLSGDVFVADTNKIYRVNIGAYESGGTATKTLWVVGATPNGGIDGITFAPDGTVYEEGDGYVAKLPSTAQGIPNNDPNYYTEPLDGSGNPTYGNLAKYARMVYIPGGLDGLAVDTAPNNPMQVLYLVGNVNNGTIAKVYQDPYNNNNWTFTTAISGGTRGDFVTVGPDHCLYATQTATIERVITPICSLAPTSVVPYLHLQCLPSTDQTGNSTSAPVGNTLTASSSFDNVANPAGASVTFTVTGPNGQTSTVSAGSSGQAALTYTGQYTGTDTVVATATVNGVAVKSNPCSFSWTANPSYTPPANTMSITGASGSGEYNDAPTSPNLSAILTNVTANAPAAGQTLNFSVAGPTGNQTCSGVTDATGKATCSITPNEPGGNYTVTVSFAGAPGQPGLGPTSGTGTFAVSKEETTTAVTPITSSFTGGSVSATLTEDASPTNPNSPIASRVVTLTLNNNPAESCLGNTNAQGVITCTITPTDPPGSYTLTASFGGDGYYLPSGGSTGVAIPKKGATLSIGSGGSGTGTGDYNDSDPVTATLIDAATHAPLANRTLTFTINNKDTCTATTDVSGVATCTITPSEPGGPYPLVVSFAGDSVYNQVSGSGTFTVTREETATKITPITGNFAGGPVSATLTEDGNPAAPIANRSVTLTLNNQPAESCTGVTNASGVVTCSIVSTESTGAYPLTATFSGDPYYLPSNDQTTVNITQKVTHITVPATNGEYDDPGAVSATLLDAGNAPIAGKTLVFTVNDKESCTGVTNASGVATCNLTPGETPGGSYTLTVTSAADSTDLASTASAPYSVKVEESSIVVAPGQGEYHDSGTVSATLLEDGQTPIAGRTLTFLVNSQETCTGVTNAQGVASCTISPSEAGGSFPLSVTFAGDPYYVPASGLGTFTEAREQTSVQFQTAAPASTVGSDGTVLYQADSTNTITVKAKLFEDNGPTAVTYLANRSLVFTLSGGPTGTCTGTIAADSTASCAIHASGTGTGTLTVNFNDGDAFYLPSTNQAKILAYGRGTGDFVIGDITAGNVLAGKQANDVYWWGSQWWKNSDNVTDNNLLSGTAPGTGPADFKGYDDNNGNPYVWCGQTWTSRPGNDSQPPSTVPDYMAIIVSSYVRRVPPLNTGDVKKIVIVRTNNNLKSGDNDFYSTNPGHAGHGPIVATLCSTP